MTNTRDKLKEAKYFLERMGQCQSDRNAFRYNLSAFLSAARSVTLFMQTEFNHAVGFNDWYSTKQHDMATDKVMKLMNEKRTVTVHQEPVRPHAHVNASFSEPIGIGESVSVVLTRADGTIERRESEPAEPITPTQSKATTEWRWFFDEFPEKDIVSLCQEHIKRLNDLVAECELRFPSGHEYH